MFIVLNKMSVYITLESVVTYRSNLPAHGYFTCGLLSLEQFENIEGYFDPNHELEDVFINRYAQHETIKLVNKTTDPTEINLLIKTFGERYILAGHDLIDTVIEFASSCESEEENGLYGVIARIDADLNTHAAAPSA
jgi:hypothetical protein